jgi:hypothetical protein
MSLHSNTLSLFRADQSLLVLLFLAREAANANIIVFGLTGSRLETTIYRTRCGHATITLPILMFGAAIYRSFGVRSMTFSMYEAPTGFLLLLRPTRPFLGR